VPVEDALTEDAPVRITALDRVRRRGMLITEIELPDESIKKGAPLGVVGFGKLEDDGNVGFDVHRLKDSSWWSGKGRRAAGGSISVDGGVGGTVVGEIGLEKWVDIHGYGDRRERVGEGSGKKSSGEVAIAPEMAASAASTREQQEEETRAADTMKEWSQQFLCIALNEYIYSVTCFAAWLTTQGATTASAARHGFVGVVTALSAGRAVASQLVSYAPILNNWGTSHIGYHSGSSA